MQKQIKYCSSSEEEEYSLHCYPLPPQNFLLKFLQRIAPISSFFLKKAPDRQSIIKRIIHSKQNPGQTRHFTSPKGPQEAVKEMADFYRKIYSGRNINHNLPNHTLSSSSLNSQNTDSDYVCPINRQAIINSIKRLPRNKSLGCDHIIAEHLEPITTPILQHLVINFLFQICWYTGLYTNNVENGSSSSNIQKKKATKRTQQTTDQYCKPDFHL